MPFIQTGWSHVQVTLGDLFDISIFTISQSINTNYHCSNYTDRQIAIGRLC